MYGICKSRFVDCFGCFTVRQYSTADIVRLSGTPGGCRTVNGIIVLHRLLEALLHKGVWFQNDSDEVV